MFFIQPNQKDIINALESWDWINFNDKTPIAVTCFGDMFFDSKSGIYFLDTLEGTLNKICEDKNELQNILNTEDGQDTYLLSGLVLKAKDEGLILEDGECYDFEQNPILGGAIEYQNMNKLSFVVSVNIAGQIHKQVKDLPPGSKISGFNVVDS